MKNIRSQYVKDSLLDYAALTKSLKENTVGAVENLLAEQVKDTYNKILSESDDDYEEEEMEDTDSDSQYDDNGTEGDVETSTEVTPDGAVEKKSTGSDGKGNEWSEFEKYKVSDDQYDFSNAEDDEIVRAYKLMKDEDQLVVTKDGDMVHLTDNDTGADYIIDLQSVPEEDETENLDSMSDDYSDDLDFENNENEVELEVDDSDDYSDFDDDSYSDDVEAETDDFNSSDSTTDEDGNYISDSDDEDSDFESDDEEDYDDESDSDDDDETYDKVE